MGALIYVWVAGLIAFVGLEIYFGTLALRNLSPDVDRNNVRFYRKLAAQWDANLFNDDGKRYRAWTIRNEIAYGFWIFVVGPVALMSIYG